MTTVPRLLENLGPALHPPLKWLSTLSLVEIEESASDLWEWQRLFYGAVVLRISRKAGEWSLASRQELRELSHQSSSCQPRGQPRNGLVRGPLGTSGCWIVLLMPE